MKPLQLLNLLSVGPDHTLQRALAVGFIPQKKPAFLETRIYKKAGSNIMTQQWASEGLDKVGWSFIGRLSFCKPGLGGTRYMEENGQSGKKEK